MNARISQKDVAVAANVSQALVSLILAEESGRGQAATKKMVRVSAATRLKVIEAAERLGYLPRANPRASALGQDKTLVYIRPPARREDSSSWVSQIEEERRQSIQNSLIEAACNQGFTMKVRICERAADILHWVQSAEVDGVFLGISGRELAGIEGARFPVISLCEKSLRAGDSVMVNQEEVVNQAVEHLQKNGHERIALLASCPGAHIAATRVFAFKECESTFGIQACESLLECASPEEFSGRFLALDRFAGRPTAIIAEDALALRILRELGCNGHSIPDDLSIIGIGNSAAAAFSAPLLTSVDLRNDEIGRAAVNLMIERLKNRPEAFLNIALSPQLQVRDSVARFGSEARALNQANAARPTQKPAPLISPKPQSLSKL